MEDMQLIWGDEHYRVSFGPIAGVGRYLGEKKKPKTDNEWEIVKSEEVMGYLANFIVEHTEHPPCDEEEYPEPETGEQESPEEGEGEGGEEEAPVGNRRDPQPAAAPRKKATRSKRGFMSKRH